jgi:hypothetical protein
MIETGQKTLYRQTKALFAEFVFLSIASSIYFEFEWTLLQQKLIYIYIFKQTTINSIILYN